jgi:hypothetical protein
MPSPLSSLSSSPLPRQLTHGSPSAFVYGNLLFAVEGDVSMWGDCAVVLDVYVPEGATASGGANVSSVLDAYYPTSACTFVNASLDHFGAEVTATSHLACQPWTENEPHDLSGSEYVCTRRTTQATNERVSECCAVRPQ